jgi:hypothetical protein
MPKKKTFLSEAERRKRLRETEREVEASGTAEDFERAFRKVTAAPAGASPKSQKKIGRGR